MTDETNLVENHRRMWHRCRVVLGRLTELSLQDGVTLPPASRREREELRSLCDAYEDQLGENWGPSPEARKTLDKIYGMQLKANVTLGKKVQVCMLMNNTPTDHLYELADHGLLKGDGGFSGRPEMFALTDEGELFAAAARDVAKADED